MKISKTQLKDNLTQAIQAWADQEGLTLDKSSVSIGLEEHFRNKGKTTIEWIEEVITECNMREILKHRFGPQPRAILEDMLKTGSREITQESFDRLATEQGIETRASRFSDLNHIHDVRNKAVNLNAQLTKLHLPYRMDTFVVSQPPYRLKKIRFVKEKVKDISRQTKTTVSVRVSIKASRQQATNCPITGCKGRLHASVRKAKNYGALVCTTCGHFVY